MKKDNLKENNMNKASINNSQKIAKRKKFMFDHSTYGITLIALVVTIVVLLILAAVSISAVFGDNGLIVKAQLASFATEMQGIKENVANKKMQVETNLYLQGVSEDLFTQKLNEQDVEIPDTLKKEILYVRAGMPEESEPNDYGVEEFESLLDESGNVEGIYIIDKKTGNGKEDTYIYDEQTGTVFKIPQTKIGGKVYHSYECAVSEKGGTGGDTSSNQAIDKESEVVQVGDEKYYAPNLKGFSATQTSVIYYNSADFTDTKAVSAQKYIEDGEPAQITEGGKTYVLHNYSKDAKIWANVKTTGFGQEAWWVWVPRYAYKADSTTKTMDIIYVDINDKPLKEEYNGELPDGYEVHSAFTVEGKEPLRGIWISKYEPSYGSPQNDEAAPDMTGFDPNNTYIELYNSATKTFDEEVLLANANLKTINDGNKWHDYKSKIWANVKTVGNGQEAWWVWIPRYAYSIRAEGLMDIIYIDTNNKPISPEYKGKGLPADYEVHPSFNVDGKKLKGIWISKYEPSFGTPTFKAETESKVLAPNMKGFDPECTYIELYDKETKTFKEGIKLADALKSDESLKTVNKNKEWYDYENKIWANVKTVGKNENGVEEEAWWVWIPRYAYNIMESKQAFDIVFVDMENKPVDPKYGTSLKDIYEVHPAFTTADGEELEGIWISKYEPSQK